MSIHVKRAYDAPAKRDGCRILVDRMWPWGISKKELQIDEWIKDLAPTTELRQWFGHDPEKWAEFKRRYFRELAEHSGEMAKLLNKARAEQITLVFSAKDQKCNNAVALKQYLERHVDN